MPGTGHQFHHRRAPLIAAPSTLSSLHEGGICGLLNSRELRLQDVITPPQFVVASLKSFSPRVSVSNVPLRFHVSP